MSHASAPGMPRVPSIIRLINPVIRRLMRIGLPTGPNVLLTVRGRSSGREHTFPVAVIQLGDRRYIQSPLGEVNWVRNLRIAREATVSRGTHHETVDAIEVPAAEGGAILRGGLDRYLRSPILSKPVALFFGLRRSSTSEDFLAVAQAHPMFELRSRAAS